MRLNMITRAAVGISMAGFLALPAVSAIPGAHAAGSAPAITVNSTNQGIGSLLQISGQGFSAGGNVTVNVLVANTGAVVFSTQAQATSNSLVQSGTTYYYMAGQLATTISLGTPCASPAVTVQAVDAATDEVSNSVPVTLDTSQCPATFTSSTTSTIQPSPTSATISVSSASQTGSTLFQINGQGFPSGASLTVQLINAANGTVIASTPVQATTSSYTQSVPVCITLDISLCNFQTYPGSYTYTTVTYPQVPGLLYTTMDFAIPANVSQIVARVVDANNNVVSNAVLLNGNPS